MIDRLASPEALLLLLLVPAAVWGLSRRRRGIGVALPSVPGRALPRTLRARLAWLPAGLRVAALLCLIVGVARPQDVSGKTRTKTQGVAIQIVVDRSGSMDEAMRDGTREARKMDVVTRVLGQFIEGGEGLEPREGDLLGLIAFARYADTIAPLVRDRSAVAALARRLDTVKQRAEDGTAIGDALALAAARLRRAEEELTARQVGRSGPESDGSKPAERDADFAIKSKVIVLLTDGVNNAGSEDPVAVARLAAEWGIKVYVIGVGGGMRYQVIRTPLGEQRIPVGPGIDEGALQAIADVTGGRYFSAGDARTLRDVYERIGELERSEIQVLEYDDVVELFGPLAMAGGVLLAIEALLGATWLRRGP